MRYTVTKFPHTDIAEDGPPLQAALCRLSREDERYWQNDLPRDHADDGVLVDGPAAEPCVLEERVGFTYCARPDLTTPENARLQHVTNKGRNANPSGYGLYGRPRKPATSGRKRKAA
jgi:hypothetical protein